jgi:hypothetical protein
MSNPASADLSQNRILSGLPNHEHEVLRPLLQPRKLHLGEVITETGEPIVTVYFPFDAAISMVNVEIQSPQTVDVALIGKEGCYGCSVVQGSDKSPSMFMVEVGGDGVQVDTSNLLQELPRLRYLRAALDRYNYLLTRLIVISVGCSQFHPPAQRLARWLMAHYYRTGITTFPFSKQFLGAQTGLDEALLADLLVEFERYGLLETGHNTVKISQPEALQSRAGMCFSLAKDATQEYLAALDEIQRLPSIS